MAAPIAGVQHAISYTDFLDLEERAQAQLVLAAATAGSTGALAEGLYDIWATTDVFVKIAPVANAVDVTAVTGYLIRANNTVSVLVRNGSKINALSVAGGTLSYHMTL